MVGVVNVLTLQGNGRTRTGWKNSNAERKDSYHHATSVSRVAVVSLRVRQNQRTSSAPSIVITALSRTGTIPKTNSRKSFKRSRLAESDRGISIVSSARSIDKIKGSKELVLGYFSFQWWF